LVLVARVGAVDCLLVWSPRTGWQRGPDVPSLRAALAALPDGKILVEAEGELVTVTI
jgi:hypothetical protein